MRRYAACVYWFAVVMVAVFGTMCADVLHVRFGVRTRYLPGFIAFVLAAVFLAWRKVEGRCPSTASIPSPGGCSTGPPSCDLRDGDRGGGHDSVDFHLGYFSSDALVRRVIAFQLWGTGVRLVPRSFLLVRLRGHPAPRRFFADWMGKPPSVGGLGWGAGPVALVLAIAIFCLVAYLAITHADVQAAAPRKAGRGSPGCPGVLIRTPRPMRFLRAAPGTGRHLGMERGLPVGDNRVSLD